MNTKLTYCLHKNVDFWCMHTFGGCLALRFLWLGVVLGTVEQRARFDVEIARSLRRDDLRWRTMIRVFNRYRARRRVSQPSGVGFWYGHRGSDHSVLEDLVKSDYDFDDLDADDIAAARRNSVVARMPMTMEAARPYDVRLRMALIAEAGKDCWNCCARLHVLDSFCDACGAEVR